ncbi:hypothetical protein QTJ16_001798 [Diplocarpon rosae]|uniref:Carrier domain-containing protein n=1 Tax=Diplocarpon rosae TaxID=946125 RepID=A0AAD9WES8_9HELO|nr:hypothetical protein QTJ16_001798 [Diplocarpon rosae]
MHKTTAKDVFLNWTGLDHIANLIEIHLHAMSLGANQVHLSAAEVLGNLLGFLEKIDKHRISYTFAPNFFLGIVISTVLKLNQGIDLTVAGDEIAVKDELLFTASSQSLSLEIRSVVSKSPTPAAPFPAPPSKRLDLSCLQALISGGEANVAQTCTDLTNYLQNSEFCCLGEPIPGIEMRILRGDGSVAHRGEIGELQVSGAVLFPCYHINVKETNLAKTSDGWFKTGDSGTLDINGRLCLAGREKDLVIVNGINLHPQNIESALNAGNICGVTPSYTVVFGHRPIGSHTEVIIVVYLAAFEATNLAAHSGAQISVNSNLFELGASSVDLLTLKMHLQQRLGIETIPITSFFSFPILRDFASSISRMSPKSAPAAPTVAEYDPVVILNPNIGSTKTPIWFIHPGMGEILIFLNLSRHITDRPVYTLRARGFDTSLYPCYTSIPEMISSYLSSIKRLQPHGPYALTYGSYECVMTVAFFLGLMGEREAYAGLVEMSNLSRDELLDEIVNGAPAGRMTELGLTREKVGAWAELAYRLKVVAWDYDPEGVVKAMDVFYTAPLVGLVQWRRDFIGKWDEFVETEVKYHVVSGTHRTIISPPFLVGFWKVFQSAMEARGL